MKDHISVEEAKQAIESASRRVALIHLAYAKTLFEELGEERATRLIARAIKDFGVHIGEQTKKEVLAQGLDLSPENFSKGQTYKIPGFGMHERFELVEVDDKPRIRAYGCVLAKTWQELGEDKLGRFYCYMDPAKYMGFNPEYKLVHVKAIPDGDAYCEFEVVPTTEKERKDFAAKDKDWFYIDKV